MDWFLRWWLRSGRYGWSKFRRSLCERKYRDSPLPPVERLSDIQAYLHQVTWTMDSFFHLYDSISYPQTVWHKKKDDCDGFAILAAALLAGYDASTRPVLLTVITHPVSASHTVCVFTSSDGNLHYFNNASLRNDAYQNYEQIMREISPPPRRVVCWDVRRWENLSLLEFHQV